MAVLSIVATLSPQFTRLVSALDTRDLHATSAAASTTAPLPNFKPLSVRPVVSTSAIAPPQCPPAHQVLPRQPLRVCDLAGTSIYELGPEALSVDLTNVASVRNPITGVELVQVTMTPTSASQLGQFSADHIGTQAAFVRGSAVVWAAKISAPLESQDLQLFGDLTPQQAEQMARTLRDAS